MNDDSTSLPVAQKGHFLLESGHHGNLWMDLELLCLHPRQIRERAANLSQRLSPCLLEAVCGPLVEGSFIALMVVMELDVDFIYADRFGAQVSEDLYPVEYRIPPALRSKVANRRVAIVNDVINAGSAVLGTYRDLRECGAEIVAIGALLVLGSWAPTFASEQGLALESLAYNPNTIWEPAECPLCAAQIPLEHFMH